MLVVMLRQRSEEGESHFAHAADKRFLLYLDTLVLQQVSGLTEDLHALGALEGAVLAHHALVLMRVRQVRYVMAARSTFVPALAPDLQRRLLSRHGVLLAVLAVLRLL